MSTIDLNLETTKAHIEAEEGMLLIDFWAPWCAPCRAFAPTYERVSEDHPDVTFGKINTEQERELGASFGIRSIPTLMVFRDGILLFSQPGMLPEAALRDLVAQAKALDMDEVRSKIAAEEAAETSAAAR